MNSEPSAVVRRLLTADRETLQEVMHPDGVIHEAGGVWFSGDWVGPDGMIAMLRTIQSRAKFTVNRFEVRAAQDAVSVRLFMTFTSRATGESMDTSVHELYTVRDGKVFDIDVYYKDTAALRDFFPAP